ncbi:MAG: hypothetical protein ACD_37C00107G0002 [uncultured bacterium]|nr:MAG: hypothetical protein ACD_37C00107G0002 [uncultured bacterium]
MDSIICPHCKKKVELSEAIVHELQEKVRSQEKYKLGYRLQYPK